MDISGQRFAASGAPLGPEFRVNTYSTGHQSVPSVAADSAGNFVVVWSGPGGFAGPGDVFGQRYASNGTPLGPEFRVNTYTTRDQRVPAVAVDAAGNFVVVWGSYGYGFLGTGIFGQRFASDGTPLGPEFRVNTNTTSGQFGQAVDADSSGNFVVVWAGGGAGIDVFGQRYSSAGIPLGPEFRLDSYTTGEQINASVALDASGNFVVAWQSYVQDGSGPGILGQRYASSGAPLGPQFRVNSYTTGHHRFPSVAAEPPGKFVVTWNSNGQDGFGAGVFGQRHSPIFPVELMHFRVE